MPETNLGSSSSECPVCGRSYTKKFSENKFRKFTVRVDASVCKARKHGEGVTTVYIHSPKKSVGEKLS